MTRSRQKAVSRSIHRALTKEPYNQGDYRRGLLVSLLHFFSIWNVRLARICAELFKHLRNEVWHIDESEYTDAFRYDKKHGGLVAMGDLGYSGSTFFRTANSKYLVKSLPRRSEHSFFKEEFLFPYWEYMKANPESLLVHITDFLGVRTPAIGTLLDCSPSHHVIMENVLCDKDKTPESDKWETYDLKPVNYFYPERDLIPESLMSESVMSRLFDEFNDKIRVTKKQFQDLRKQIEQDTEFLMSGNTVDYSMFLVRYPAHLRPSTPTDAPNEWQQGALSTDGKWKYRIVLLDFFWAKHKFPALALTGVVQTFNVVGRKGPMSITTTAEEYREKFLQMLDEMVELQA